MTVSVEEGKALRLAGAKRELSGMTGAHRVQRALTTGRPPTGELKTTLAAVTAARTLHAEIEKRLRAEGVSPVPGDWGVSVGYVTPDLTTVGPTLLYAPGEESRMMAMLDGNIMTGLVFGICDREAEAEDASAEDRIVMGIRPFMAMKQTEIWLGELILHVRFQLEDASRMGR